MHVKRIVEAARMGGYPAALRMYRVIVLMDGMDTSDAMLLGMAVRTGLRDAGVTIKETTQ